MTIKDKKFWETKIKEQEKSGKSTSEFCREQKIKLGTFYYWKGRLKKEHSDTDFVEISNLITDTKIFEISMSQDGRITISFQLPERKS